MLTFWFLVLGLPLLAYGLASLVVPGWTGSALVKFMRCRAAGWVLAAIGWAWTASACDRIGIDIFDKFLKAFPGELWILAVVLTILTCFWMENLLPIRGVCAIFMLFPGEMFPAIRLCDTEWRLALVVVAYICAIVGMFGMFYPWRIRQAVAWRAASAVRMRIFGLGFAGTGALLTALGACAAAGLLK